jgi:hypothetical protein
MHRKKKFVRYNSKTEKYLIRDYREASSKETEHLTDSEKRQAHKHPDVWVMVK